jgi:hypothetical protein
MSRRGAGGPSRRRRASPTRTGSCRSLPSCRAGERQQSEPEDIRAGFALTSYFLRLHVFDARGVATPEERARFIALAAPSSATGEGSPAIL